MNENKEIIEELKNKKGVSFSTIEIAEDGNLIWMREREKVGEKEKISHYVTLKQKNLSLRDHLRELPKIERNDRNK